jgi:hypothetical protein
MDCLPRQDSIFRRSVSKMGANTCHLLYGRACIPEIIFHWPRTMPTLHRPCMLREIYLNRPFVCLGCSPHVLIELPMICRLIAWGNELPPWIPSYMKLSSNSSMILLEDQVADSKVSQTLLYALATRNSFRLIYSR